MIPDQTIHPVIIRYRVSGSHLDNNLFVCVALYGSFHLVEWKDVVGVSEEFKLSVELGVVVKGENFAWSGVQFDLAKVYTVRAEGYVELVWVAFEVQVDLVAALAH